MRTFVTGIRPGDLENEPDSENVLEKVRKIINGKYLVGHDLTGDTIVLEYFVPPYQGLRDTGKYLAWTCMG